MNDELLDNDQTNLHTAEISFKNGRSFSGMVRFFGVALMLVGCSAIMSLSIGGIFIGLIIFGGGGFLFTSTYGTDICNRTNHVREYHEIFFIKTGKWKSAAPYSDICIIKLGKTAIRSDLAGTNSTGIDVSKSEVYLMTYDHRKRFLLKVCNSAKEAVKEAEFLADILDKKMTVFNPQISEATKARLRHRR